MRRSSLPFWLSVVVVSAAEASAHGPVVRVLPAREGGAAQVKVYGDGDAPVKVRFRIETIDGARTELPPIETTLPLPGGTLEGPTIPTGTAGGTLIVEIIDKATGQPLSKGATPIGG